MRRMEDILAELEARRNKRGGVVHFQAYLNDTEGQERELVCIHVAGTNGKGSTVNYLRAMLQEAGLRVGTFTSPYLETHFDRIRINDEPIPASIFRTYYEQDHRAWYAHELSSFEIDTAIAFRYFHDQSCQICIIETGIGGRFDCTNVVQPILSVITNIGKDHMEQLGSTIEEIAWQKGGIIKQGIPCITGERNEACLRVFASICQTQQSELIPAKQAEAVTMTPEQLAFRYRDVVITLPHAPIYQVENCCLALEAIHQLQKQMQIHLTLDQIKNALAHAVWKGRFEIVHEHPTIIVDGAHNEEGIRALCKSLRPYGHVRILFAALKDKDTHAMMEELCAVSTDVCVSEFSFDRVKPAKELAESFPVLIDEDYRHAIEAALQDETSPLVITGSLYFISEVRSYLMKRRHVTGKQREG